jgi:hypothetical protein
MTLQQVKGLTMGSIVQKSIPIRVNVPRGGLTEYQKYGRILLKWYLSDVLLLILYV